MNCRIFQTFLQAINDIVTSRMNQYQAAMMKDDVFDEVLARRVKILQDENFELRGKAALLQECLYKRNCQMRIEKIATVGIDRLIMIYRNHFLS